MGNKPVWFLISGIKEQNLRNTEKGCQIKSWLIKLTRQSIVQQSYLVLLLA